MKIPLKEILEQNEEGQIGLKAGFTKLEDTKLPTKIGWDLSKLIKQLYSEVKLFHEKRDTIVKKLGTETEGKPGHFEVSKENIKEFGEEMNELLNVEIDLSWNKVKVEDLGNITMEPKYLIDFLFE